ncbi:unnamed protein product, partial [Ectocarpus sp. 8 AP-2014]
MLALTKNIYIRTTHKDSRFQIYPPTTDKNFTPTPKPISPRGPSLVPGARKARFTTPKSIHRFNRNPVCPSAYTDALYNSTALDAAEEDCAHDRSSPHAHHQNTTHALDKKNEICPVVEMPLGVIGRCTAATSFP